MRLIGLKEALPLGSLPDCIWDLNNGFDKSIKAVPMRLLRSERWRLVAVVVWAGGIRG